MIRPNRNANGKVTSWGVRIYLGSGKWRWVGSYKTRALARDAEAEALLRREQARAPSGRELHDWFLGRYERDRKDEVVP